MKTALAVIVAETDAPSVAAVFDLQDPAELFMVETMQRFHDGGLYRAHAVKRTKTDAGRIVVELASFNPRNRAQSHMLIFWEVDGVAIRFKDCAGMTAARAEFDAA